MQGCVREGGRMELGAGVLVLEDVDDPIATLRCFVLRVRTPAWRPGAVLQVNGCPNRFGTGSDAGSAGDRTPVRNGFGLDEGPLSRLGRGGLFEATPGCYCLRCAQSGLGSACAGLVAMPQAARSRERHRNELLRPNLPSLVAGRRTNPWAPPGPD